MRVGIGYDVHKLVEGRKLVLGGVEINHYKGLLGHSDADVLIHAIMDALLGAAALRSIGYYFPDNDNSFKNISSLILLEKVKKLLDEKNYEIVNIDSVIIAQKPKIMPYIEEMKKNISEVLKIETENIGIKATTEEYLGFTGDESGIKAVSVCVIKRREK
jgi:2-C-methyl-D-erythritol 2,4-cyclodiphosphate synthase